MNDDPAQAFEKAGTQANPGVTREFLQFLRQNKKYWLIPLLASLALLAGLVLLGGTAAAPFIYSLF